MKLIRNGVLFANATYFERRHFLAIVGVLTNQFDASHVLAHRGVNKFNIRLKYVSCVPLGYKNQILVNCSENGLSQLEHTKLWLTVAPTLFLRATYICKMDIDTFIVPRLLKSILKPLSPPSVWGRSCWVDPCFWGVQPLSPKMLCMYQNVWKSCAGLSRVFCGICGGFYALSYDVAATLSRVTSKTPLIHFKRMFNENEEDRFVSHLVRQLYGGDFWFASDTTNWQTYPNYNHTHAAVIHGIKTTLHWRSVVEGTVLKTLS